MVEGGGEDKASVRAPAVFISYASQDVAAAARVCSALRQTGVEVWFDQSELRGGDVWDQRIRREIRDCTLFMPVISANTASRHEGYFRLEWDLADQRTHMMSRDRAFIVPVCLDATKEAGTDVPESFHRVQWTRLLDGNTPLAFTARIVALLGAPGVAASAAGSSHSAAQTGHGAPPALTLTATVTSTLRKHRLDIALMTTISVILAYVAVDRLWLHKNTPAEKPAAAMAPAPTAAVPAIPEKSVAVLPFVDMSEKRDQEYFADGLTEELIDLLARGSEIRVPARTSSFYFKGKQATLAEIAKALGVTHVLEGSVRKAGNTMRITVQLIRATDGYHAWSGSYDRDLKDVFKVQDEIAGAVVSVLKAKLSTSPVAAGVRRTASAEAYDQYLIGRQFVARRTEDSFERATGAFQKAITIDPTFAAAYAGLSEAQYLHADGTGQLTASEFARIQSQLSRAIELGPDLSDGYSERGVERLVFLGDLVEAQADLSRAISLEPTSSTNQRRYGLLLRCLGRVQEAIRYGRQATDTDPLDAFAWLHLGESLLANGQYTEARDAFTKILEVNPEDTDAFTNLLDVMLLQGHGDEALHAISKLEDPKSRLYYTAMAEFTIGHEQDSRKALEAYIDTTRSGAPRFTADVYAWRGEIPQALPWLEKAAAQRKGSVACISSAPPYLRLHDNPQFKAFLRRMKLQG